MSSSSNVPVKQGRVTRKVERSCMICHRRKVRCDKKLPCSNCTRGGVLCCYPAGDKPAPRQPKSTIADIASRLVQLERTIIAISGDSSHSDHSSGERVPTNVERQDDESKAPIHEPHASGTSSVDELLVEHGSSSRYINEILLSRVLEEEQEMQSAMASPRPSESDGYRVPPLRSFNLFGLSLSHSAAADLRGLHPPPYQAMQLWNIFVQNVDPVSKFLHIPTAQVDVFTVINNQTHPKPDMHCFLFSIFFAATTALSPSDVVHLLGEDKPQVLTRFKYGLELSLAEANILESPTIRALQAIALFLTIHRAHNPSRSTWILSGLAIRAAQSIGLHRDGSKFKLPPFETEIRRRLWWYLVCHDGRAGEDHGITISGLDQGTDCQLPLNLDDGAFGPETKVFPQEQSRWSEMTLSLNMYVISKTMRRLHMMVYNTGPRIDEEKRRDLINALTTRVEKSLQHCNPVVPIQRLTMNISRIVLRKLDFISKLPWLGGVNPREILCTEATLLNAVEILELNLQIVTDELFRNYAWVGELYPQYHTLLYSLWHLSQHPVGPIVDRAWAAVNQSFEQERTRQQRQEQSGSTAKWVVLTMLKEKASRARKSSQEHGTPAEAPLERLEVENGREPSAAGGNDPIIDTFRMDMSWDPGFVDWNFLVDEFTVQPDGGVSN